MWWLWRSWLARQIVALEAVGSNPTSHPTKKANSKEFAFSISSRRKHGVFAGLSPSGKARDFDSRIRGFESRQPNQKIDRCPVVLVDFFDSSVTLGQIRRQFVKRRKIQLQRFPSFLPALENTAAPAKSPGSGGIFWPDRKDVWGRIGVFSKRNIKNEKSGSLGVAFFIRLWYHN